MLARQLRRRFEFAYAHFRETYRHAGEGSWNNRNSTEGNRPRLQSRGL